jgi:hypothetical protein
LAHATAQQQPKKQLELQIKNKLTMHATAVAPYIVRESVLHRAHAAPPAVRTASLMFSAAAAPSGLGCVTGLQSLQTFVVQMASVFRRGGGGGGRDAGGKLA